MKKILSIAIVTIMLFALVACNNGDMQSKIAELEAAMQAQTDKIAELEQGKAEQAEQITNLEQTNSLLQELLQLQQEKRNLMEETIDILKGEEIKYTAQSPTYGPRENEQILMSVSNATNQTGLVPLENFLEYYDNEFQQTIQNDFYILYPHDDTHELHNPYPNKGYEIVTDENNENPLIRQFHTTYDNVVGSYEDHLRETREGGSYFSIEMIIYFAPLPSDSLKGSVPYFEFGHLDVDSMNEYCNIYMLRDCIATCYFTRHTKITERWFELYFMENLILLDKE